jgi:hypothetical protein
VNSNTFKLGLESLENREVLSGSGFSLGGFGLGLWNVLSSPAVQADLAKIKTDTQALHTEIVSLAPTLQKDAAAVGTAIQNAMKNDPTVVSVQTTLTNDEATWKTTLSNDRAAIRAATTPTTKSTAAAQLKSDLKASGTAIAADLKALHAAIENDAGVVAAQKQLTSDSAPITADEATLKADFTQLWKDVSAASSSSSTTTSSFLGGLFSL